MVNRTTTILDWASAFGVAAKPWLMLGKGPSFELFEPEMADRFHILGLNHIVRQTPVTLAHFIDIDAFLDCVPAVLAGAQWVCIPWHPHEGFSPGKKTLADYSREVPALQQLDEEGRLLTYNLSTGDKFERLSGAPLIEAKFFSAEAGLNVLVACGSRVVRSLGVDGGIAYAGQFDDLATRTRLANGQPSFDLQFSGIARTIRRTGVDYAPLHIDSPVRIFVGADETQELPCRVLEFSIKKFASLSVEIKRIDNTGLAEPKAAENRSRTGFSFSRFKIPSLCGYSGRAIYLDADMQVFTDIKDLWTLPFNGASMLYAEHDSADGRIPQFSVLVLNCAELDWKPDEVIDALDTGNLTYEELMYRFALVSDDDKGADVPGEWNSLECYVPGETRLLHYTDMPTQPWVNRQNRNWKIWISDLRCAMEEGFISQEFLYEQIARGHVSPELPAWVGLPLPESLQSKIGNWVAPYRAFIRPRDREPGKARETTPRYRHLLTRRGLARVVHSFRDLIRN